MRCEEKWQARGSNQATRVRAAGTAPVWKDAQTCEIRGSKVDEGGESDAYRFERGVRDRVATGETAGPVWAVLFIWLLRDRATRHGGRHHEQVPEFHVSREYMGMVLGLHLMNRKASSRRRFPFQPAQYTAGNSSEHDSPCDV